MADVKQIIEEMFKMVERDRGVKKYKSNDLSKAMRDKFGASRDECKLAIRELIESGRLVYTYYGGSYIEIPHQEGAAAAADALEKKDE